MTRPEREADARAKWRQHKKETEAPSPAEELRLRRLASAQAAYRQARAHADRWLDRALAEPDSERVVAMASHWWGIAQAQQDRMDRAQYYS